ncbi:redoxin domain-containing protein [Parvularcula sp. LCG005]|uniref:redoxin domain-containing protein n=1 Tax=Parvularcula sp. LCG005 TaxID=3078805 RepID=UPI002941DFEA|nr:redoxin domain-containing protein [Parvularcula sp. LCG005]WOI53951.1 redoxin domain-containing protein [Parvularcula sp. LCG005]
MKTLLSMMACGVAAIGLAVAAPAVGSQAPDFTGMTASGKRISLSEFEGKKVVLEWTNDGCPFVQKHYDSGNMQALQKKVTSDGTVWISIISSAPGQQGHATPEQANTLTKDRNAAPNYVVLDESGEIGKLYGAKTTPHMFVIDEAQTLQYAGAIDSIPSSNQADISRATNYVTAALNSLRSGEAVVTRQSQPYGCSVKYAS